MNQPTPSPTPQPTLRQQSLDFTGTERWQQLPDPSRQACCQALAQLLQDCITQTPKDQDHE